MDDVLSPTMMPVLRTDRLSIRPFRQEDLDGVYRILDLEVEAQSESAGLLAERRAYLIWSMANARQFPLLTQPPYGDRAIERLEDGAVIGACGLVPSLAPFGHFPAFAEVPEAARSYYLPQVGLYYALSTSVRGQGYATEAARALIEFGFSTLNLWRIIAQTTSDNAGSIGVMRRLGMTVERNESGEPPWLQVVGTLVNPALTAR